MTTPRSCRTTIALRGYEHRHQRPANDLAELVPEFLSAVPVDSFDGAPLRYDKERRLLWSVGRNLKDESGVAHPDHETHDEPSWPLTWDAASLPANAAP